MNYNFLLNFSSILGVYTAIYVSIFFDGFLIYEVWTPNYKRRIFNLIESLDIPTKSFFKEKITKNIERNESDIKGHMKRKSIFLLIFCMSLLLLAGLEKQSVTLHKYGYLIVTTLSFVSFVFIVLGRYTFIKYPRVVLCVLFYGVLLLLFFLSGLANTLSILCWLGRYKVAVGCMLFVMTLPILWQIFLIWIYSSLYKDYMSKVLIKEAEAYETACKAFQIKDKKKLPPYYKGIEKELEQEIEPGQDISLNSLNAIFISRIEERCELPNVLKIFLSWVNILVERKRVIKYE